MGNEVSKQEKQEKKILRSPNVGEASDLYWASRAGDVDSVRQILAHTSFNDLNRLEPNGSTALHAASFFGHADVVRLLLRERGVMRHRKNRHGMTAYEEAANEEIRQLFHRPNSHRFCNDSTDTNENIFSFTNDQPPEDDKNEDETSTEWVIGFDNELHIKAVRAITQLLKVTLTSPLLRPLVKFGIRYATDFGSDIDKEIIATLQEYIDKCITKDDPQYEKVCELLLKYEETKKVEHLLRLYSLETPFYQQLGTENKLCLLFPLMFQLDTVRTRAFRGRTYRGLSMAKSDFRPYQLAFEKKRGLIYTRSFCSTSVDESVARSFILPPCNEKLRVLMIFEFSQTCDMAIQLYALSETLPCISDFEKEREVLLLPWTMFRVVSITNEESSDQYVIHLENVLPKMNWEGWWSTVRYGTMDNLNL